MRHVDGTSARQLDLIDPETTTPITRPAARTTPRAPQAPTFRLLQRDVYAQLARRRRRAQIAARRMLDM